MTWTDRVAQVVQYLTNKHETLSLSPSVFPHTTRGRLKNDWLVLSLFMQEGRAHSLLCLTGKTAEALNAKNYMLHMQDIPKQHRKGFESLTGMKPLYG
jgi:hypothetical protein